MAGRMKEDLIIKSKWELNHAEEIKNCKGRVYKCKVNKYVNGKDEYVEQIRMIPMKKMSCPGCEVCDWADEYLPDSNFWDNIEIDVIDDGAFYMLDVINISKDWESGIVDDWDLGFKKLACKDKEILLK